MDDLTLYAGLGSVPIVMGLTEAVKRLLALSDSWAKRLLPLIAIISSIGFNALVATVLTPQPNWAVVAVFGIIAGLAASGLYSGSKAGLGS